MLNDAVLLLNSTYEPLNVINVKRALRLLFTHKAENLERNGEVVHSMGREIPLPAVVRLAYYVKRPSQRVKFTKQTVLARDQYTCMYCGLQTRELTLDHVIPKVRGGQTVWNNVVACCKKCNGAKGHKSVKDAGLKLIKVPREPRFLPYIRLVRHTRHDSWDKYLFTDTSSTGFLIRGPLPKPVVA